MAVRLKMSRLRRLVRNFKENGIKMMLEHPENVRETVVITSRDWARRIDFSTLQQTKTTFVRRDFRHIESDIVYTAQLLGKNGRRLKHNVLLYLLIEHQSEPDRLMPLRLTDYVMQIFNHQVRQWAKKHPSLSGLQLSPVLPMVLYTGRRSWESIGSIDDLFDSRHDFRAITPTIEQPLFLNLPELAGDALDRAGAFGSVLNLIRQRRSKPVVFRRILQSVIRKLESLPTSDRLRWLDLMSYIHAMIYHERSEVEQAEVHDLIEQSVGTDPQRHEVNKMRTAADALREQGIEQGIEQGVQQGVQQGMVKTLTRQLQSRFGDDARNAITIVNSTEDVRRLEQWLDRFATCDSLEDLQITLP